MTVHAVVEPGDLARFHARPRRVHTSGTQTPVNAGSERNWTGRTLRRNSAFSRATHSYCYVFCRFCLKFDSWRLHFENRLQLLAGGGFPFVVRLGGCAAGGRPSRPWVINISPGRGSLVASRTVAVCRAAGTPSSPSLVAVVPLDDDWSGALHLSTKTPSGRSERVLMMTASTPWATAGGRRSR